MSALHRFRLGGLVCLSLVTAVVILGDSRIARAQAKPPDPATMLLDSGRRAYNEKNYPFAAARLREFLAKFGGHKDAPLARYSLALVLIHGPEKNYQEVVNVLQPITGNKDFAEQPQVLYYLALARRGLGINELVQAAAKPQEAPQRRTVANQRFDEATRDFEVALKAFLAKAKVDDDPPKAVTSALEWAARARCDLAEMYLRTQKFEQAKDAAAPFFKEMPWVKSRYRTQGLYYHGLASFHLKNYPGAVRSLTQKGVTDDSIFGPHARYLLARLHHLQGERAEAAEGYATVLIDYEKQKKAAADALRNPAQFQNNPEEKARLEALVKQMPDHVARSLFYVGVLDYEAGKFGEAQARLTEFIKQFPDAPLTPHAQLRLGFAQVQLQQFAEAQKTLAAVTAKSPPLADQALFWTAKAQVAAANPDNPQAYTQALNTAIATLRQAADRANQLAPQDPEAKARRGVIMLELADTLLLNKQARDAANLYQQLFNEKALPKRNEELLQRQATALHLAGAFGESDQVCQRFQKDFPQSTLLPAVLFRQAENAWFQAQAVEKNPNQPNRAQELARINDEIIQRYKIVVERFPEFGHVNLARYGLAMGLYRKGDLDKAQQVLEAIPQSDRQGPLAAVPLVLADCLIRQTPTAADDALAAGKIHEQLKTSIELLEAYTGAQPKGPQTPDALLKLGMCYQRLAAVLAEPPERAKVLASARATYERLTQQFPKHALEPQAILERAKCIALAGDTNGAMNELRRFTNDPLKNSAIAPMGLIQLGTLLRQQNRAKEAADILDAGRKQHEANLGRDPERAGWVGLLRFHHGLALQAAGNLKDARNVFDQVARESAAAPVGGEAAYFFGQCLRQEALQVIDKSRKMAAQPNLKPEQVAEVGKQRDAGQQMLRDAATYLEAKATQLRQAQPTAEAAARMFYEAAWAWHGLAEFEVERVRERLQEELRKKLQDEIAKKTAPGQAVPQVAAPPVPRKAIPLQPAEQKAQAAYEILVKDFANLPLANHARLELSELLAERQQWDKAIELLAQALENEPPPELADQIQLRLGACKLGKGETKEGLTHFQILLDNPKCPLLPQATAYAGECLMRLGEWGEAIKLLVKFRDHGPFQNLPGVSDRALVRLGQAYAQLQQWDPSRQANEVAMGRFPNSPWVNEARYGAGWAWQNQKQYDNAVNVYSQVVNSTGAEVAAKAQLQIGLCRRDQKRYPEAATALLVVPFTYDYPEWNAVALFEAHRVFVDMKDNVQAVRLLQQLVRRYPESRWAQLAQERLKELQAKPTPAAGGSGG
jgi:tetratricopeptide (TPR) repeat protein